MGISVASLYRHQIDREERAIGLPLTVLREILSASVGLMTKFVAAQPLLGHRGEVSALMLHAARITALRSESCDECVDIGLAYARRDGVTADALWDLARGRFESLPGDAALAARFAAAILASDPGALALGEEIEKRFGRAARLELALAAATSRIFPVVKRGLGLAGACAVPHHAD